MKQFFLGIVLLCCYSQGFGQFQIHPDSSFYTFLDSFYTRYQDDGAEGGIYNQVRRDVETWGTRLAPSGNMSKATKALTEYAKIYNGVTPAPTSSGIPIVFPSEHPASPLWDELGPQTPVEGTNSAKGMGQIHRLAFHPNYNGTTNQIIYAGSHFAGLYRTDDGGVNWYNYYTDRELPITSVADVAVSSDEVFICTGNGDYGYSNFGFDVSYSPLGPGRISNANPIHTQGVYMNIAGTNTWTEINGVGNSGVTMIDNSLVDNLLTVFSEGGTMRNIIVNPNGDDTLHIATSQGVFRSTNKGSSWRQVLVGPSDGNGGYIWDTEWRGLEYHPTNRNIMYASGSKDIYKSTDGGETWNSMTANLSNLNVPFSIQRINIAVTPAAPDNLYAYVVSSGRSQVYLFNGTVWSLQANIFEGNPPWMGIAVSPINAQHVLIGELDIYESTNVGTGGATNFSNISLGISYELHDDVHDLVFSPTGNATEIFAATHGGVSKYTPTGWIPLYNGLSVATIWAFDDWEGNDSIIITANQDIGVNHTINYKDWRTTVSGGDGYSARIDDQSGKAYLKHNVYSGIYKIGFDLTRVEPYYNTNQVVYPLDTIGVNARIPNAFPMLNHPKTDEIYLGFSELYNSLTCAIPYNIVGTFYDTTILTVYEPDTYLLKGTEIYNGGFFLYNTSPSPFNKTCLEIGVVIGLDTTYPKPSESWLLRIDTLCYIDTTTYDTVYTSGPVLDPDLSTEELQNALYKKGSDLKKYQPSTWNRRIMEIAFSEDENTNYTYLATLGDNDVNGWRQCDFYFNDADSLGCDTCFIKRTSTIPISSISTLADPNPITGIVVDPLNGDRVWTSYTGFDKDIKVYYSEDAGQSWVNYDDTLGSLANLNMPINNIVYQRGTNDRLYIATDVGVYVREGTGNWLRYGDEFPNVRTTELKINYCSGKLRAATFGRGVWEADLLPAETSIDYRSFRTITGTQIWNTDKNMVRDIKVKAGAILILDSMTLNMPKDGLIVVEPGALLVVDSSRITNLCGETWQGIQVWGNSNLSQVPTNQGQIIVSASTIEYAKNAISPWEVGNFPNPANNTGGTGGIITAQNSTFANNWRSIEFMRYISPTGAKELSTLHNCTFTVNDDYRPFDGDTIPYFLGHVSMWSVGGTEIKGCTFKDERSNKAGDATTGGSFGLGGLAGSPKVSRLLFPSKRTRFEGLERAVEFGGPRGTNYTTTIDECTFVDNEQALILRAHNDAVIIRDSFEIGGFVSSSPNSYFVEEYGLGLVNTTSFAVEQNYFTSNTSNDQTVGSWVEASGSAGNRIRNNQYEHLTGGNLAHGQNDGALPDDGLQYYCNENTSNDYDFTVLANIASNAAPANIGQQQGMITQASRNTFSNAVLSLPSQAQFYNYNYDAALGQFGGAVQYYYTSDPAASISETPDAALLFNINLQVVPFLGNTHFCAENYTGTGTFKLTNGEGEIVSLASLKESYATSLENYTLLKVEYDEIPEEDSTARSDKASELAGAYQERFFWINQVIQHYANDTIPQNDSLETWLKKKPGVEAQYELVEHYWRQGRYDDALDQIDYIGTTYSLDSLALKNHNHYKDLKELLQTAYANGRMEANLEKTEVDALEVIANAKWGFAAVQASDILKFFYFKGTLYYPTLPNMNPVEGRSIANTGNNTTASIAQAKEPILVGAPNPAINWVDLYYQLPKDIKTGHLVVTSTAGMTVEQLELQKNAGQITLNTKDWVSGIYFAALFSEGKEAKVFKIVIQK